jgi:hypothetical protein
LEGIFPKSYVKAVDEKAGIYTPPPSNNYGNMPLAVSQGGSNPPTNDPEQKSKFEQNGKKFGKKLGNAGMSRVHRLILMKNSNHFCSNFRCRCYCRLQHREQYLLNSIHISLILRGLEIHCLARHCFFLIIGMALVEFVFPWMDCL